VDVVEALHRHVALVFHQRIVRAAQIREAGAAGRRDALGLGLGDARGGQAEHAARAEAT